MISYLWCLKNK